MTGGANERKKTEKKNLRGKVGHRRCTGYKSGSRES